MDDRPREGRRARLAQRERDGGRRRDLPESVQHGFRRARQFEDRRGVIRSDEEIADGGQDFREEIARLFGRPQARSIVDVEGDGDAGLLGLPACPADDGPQILSQGRRDPRQVHHPRVAHEPPIHLVRHELAQGRFPPIIEHAHGARGRAVLEEVQAHPTARPPQDPGAIHAVSPQLSHRAIAPRVLGGQRRDEPRAQAEPGHRGQHVGLGAADLHVEREGLIEAKRGRRGQAQHDFAQSDEVVAHGRPPRPRL